ncbi:putative receptor-like protein kinase At5g39000 [Bidens hawaiensis]|uniref:putative receptor-like protein kinase At5g39000 n=1 Tax=Bidens hawaiensis TaxID=980011 RepID=UPI00404B5EFD
MCLIEELKHLRKSFQDIKEATLNFTTLIGSGGYGPVYRGQLSLSSEPTVVAVKQLKTDNISGQGLKEFLTEIQMLSRYKHQNIVSLLGFCEEGDQKFLIYEYAEHGSLDKYLRPTKTTCPLTWKQRISICVDAARGLDHLHNHVAKNQRVIHRDIKSANILLDHNWKAMIADFGLSKIGRANESITYIITNASGTHGYCDPAYIRTGILTKESDVYSFGVVLLEVLCGRLCFKNVNGEDEYLAPLARRHYQQQKLDLIIDDDLKKYMGSYSMKVFTEIAFQCLQDDRKQRPSMGLVVKKLEKALKYIEIEEAPDQLRKLRKHLSCCLTGT